VNLLTRLHELLNGDHSITVSVHFLEKKNDQVQDDFLNLTFTIMHLAQKQFVKVIILQSLFYFEYIL